MNRAQLLLLMQGGRASAAWTPASPLNGQLPVAWLAADRLTGFADNDVIQTWANDGTFAADAITTDAAKYVYKTNIINGLPAIYVNVPDAFMTITGLFDSTYNTAFTAYVMCAGKVLGTAGGATVLKNKGLNTGFKYSQDARSLGAQMVSTNTTGITISDTTLSDTWGYGVTYNGTRVRQAANGNFSNTNFSSNLALSGDLAIGGIVGQATNYRMFGYLAEVLIYKASLSDADFLIPLEYFATKYAVPFCTVRLCTLGDSMTAGTGSTGGNDYPHQLNALLGSGYYLLNIGVSGSATTTLEAQQGAAANAYFNATPTCIDVIWIGTNDIVGGVSAATIATNIGTIHAARKTSHPTVKTVICTIVDRVSFDAAKEAVRATLNADLVANYATYNADAVCNLAADARLSDSTNTTYFSDGTHLTNAGYAVVAELLAPVVASLA